MNSFRDPDGFVSVAADGRVFRCVHPHAAQDLRAFLSSSLAAGLMAEGALAGAEELCNGRSWNVPDALRARFPPGSMILEHDSIPFPSFPYEWPPEMLHSAAALTLGLARAAAGAGFILKDASPYNVMFDGPRPVFLDLSSFRRRDPLDAMWQPYAQFMRTFVYPLLACRFFGLRLDELLLSNRDGLEPGRMLALCPPFRRLLPPFLGTVTIPALLERRRQMPRDQYRSRPARDAEEAAFVLDRLFARARGLLGYRPPPRRGATLEYRNGAGSYTPAQFVEKERFLVQVFERKPPRRLLDIGCHNGHFSLLAARHGGSVVAIDRDPGAAGILWRSAHQAKANVLPLAVDIARPPGACGWANRECASFVARASGRFDYVLLLAILHHLVVNERVPLAEIFALAAELTTEFAVIEYIDPADPQFQSIARGRDELHRELTRQTFECAAADFFQIVHAQDVSSTPRVYVMRKNAKWPMLRRLAICAALATWCFLNTWVEFAEGESAYFSRHDPVRAVVIPVLAWQLVLTLALFAAWELLKRRTHATEGASPCLPGVVPCALGNRRRRICPRFARRPGPGNSGPVVLASGARSRACAAGYRFLAAPSGVASHASNSPVVVACPGACSLPGVAANVVSLSVQRL